MRNSKIIKENRWIVIGVLVFVSVIIHITCRNRPDTVQPVRRDIIDAVFASGYVIHSDEYIVASKIEGFILKSSIKEGDEVEEDDLLFQISGDVQSSQLENAVATYNDALSKANPDSPQITSLQTQIEQAQAKVELDKKNYERYSALIETNAVSKLEFDKAKLQYENSLSELQVHEKSLEDLMSSLKLNLKNAENQLKIQQDNYRDYFIKSFKKGRILNIFKEQGELIRRGESLAKIGSGRTIARLFLAEEDINLIAVGQKTKISLNTDKDHPVDAVVSKIYPSFDFSEQSFIIEAEFQEPEIRILANTQLQANIVIAEKQDALMIPAEYLHEGNRVVLTDNSEVAVQTGVRSGHWVEILSGIDETNTLKPKKNQ